MRACRARVRGVRERVPFALAVCAPGFEAAMKDDVMRARTTYRLALSRPGLVTWKTDVAPPPDELPPTPYARVWGISLGKGDEALALAPPGAHLHVIARAPEEDGAAAEVARVIDALAARGLAVGGVPAIGDDVVDVIVAPGEPWVVGHHRHTRWRAAAPGGAIAVDVPPESPSRAYAKLEEAIAWASLPVVGGQTAVEIGSAPGGAAYALARRGVTVHGVDPGDMDAGVLAYRGPAGARVHHLRETLASVRWEQLPRAVDWLLVDVNLAAPVAVHGVARLVPAWKKTLRGAVVTLKLNDAAMRRGLPTWLDRVRRLGFAEVHATHLPTNRLEVCCVALRDG